MRLKNDSARSFVFRRVRILGLLILRTIKKSVAANEPQVALMIESHAPELDRNAGYHGKAQKEMLAAHFLHLEKGFPQKLGGLTVPSCVHQYAQRVCANRQMFTVSHRTMPQETIFLQMIESFGRRHD